MTRSVRGARLKSGNLVLPSFSASPHDLLEKPVAVGSIVTSHPSLLPAIGRIAEMAKLPANWDGEGADPPTASAVAAACYLIEAVPAHGTRHACERVPPATSSPIPDGGLQIEWKGRHARIDVQANPDGSYGYLVKWGSGADAKYEESDEDSLEIVLALIDRVLSS